MEERFKLRGDVTGWSRRWFDLENQVKSLAGVVLSSWIPEWGVTRSFVTLLNLPVVPASRGGKCG